MSFLMISFLIVSCFKSETYPIEPMISDAEVSNYTDSIVVSFAFQDGDADLGLDPADTTGVYAPGSYYYYNIYLDYFEKDDTDGWVPGKDLNGDTIQFSYRIKPISVSQNTKGIKGTMDVTVTSYANPFSNQSDTIKFKIKLIDRALHESNIIETPEIISQ
ncbi:MAG: hypothetical protein R2780_01040 [Crocinitomicaceae bacterium]|nr:hypothetical protein [Crocinitomicaceae bacterium]